MDIINKRLSLNEFRHYIKDYDFGPVSPNKLVIHHTYKPNQSTWSGERTMLGLKRHYEGKGWPAGPHLFIAEDGIWLFSPMQKDGVHARSLNRGSIGIEVVGDYTNQVWSGTTKANAFGAIKSLMVHLRLSDSDIYFHKESSPTSCPGNAITKEWLFAELDSIRLGPRIPRPTDTPSIPVPSPAYLDDEEMVLIEVPDWTREAVDFVATHKLFKIKEAEDVRDAVKFYRFYKLIRQYE